MASNLNLDLSSVRKLNKFYADIFIIDSKDENEIQKSLNDLPVYVNKLNDVKSWIIIFGSAEDSERVVKILRSFGVHPLQIPMDMPQNPSIAYAQSQRNVKELKVKNSEIVKKIKKTKDLVYS